MSAKAMITVCVWADGTWLMPDEVEDHPYLSDDFEIVDFWVRTEEDLEVEVHEYISR